MSRGIWSPWLLKGTTSLKARGLHLFFNSTDEEVFMKGEKRNIKITIFMIIYKDFIKSVKQKKIAQNY
jgi:hypothetical protein